MSVDESWVANDTFTNVGRKVFFGKVEPDHPYWLSVFGYDFDGDGVKVIFSSNNFRFTLSLFQLLLFRIC